MPLPLGDIGGNNYEHLYTRLGSCQIGQIEIERLVAVSNEQAVLHLHFRDLDDGTPEVGFTIVPVWQPGVKLLA